MTTTDRRVLAALAAVSVAVLAGCGDSGGRTTPRPSVEPTVGSTAVPVSENGPVSTLDRPQVTFEARLRADGPSVAVSYRLSNDGDEPLAVPNLLPTPSGATVAYVDSVAWATRAGDHGVLLAQAFYAKPHTVGQMTWEQIPEVGVTVLGPGDDLAGEISVPRPLGWRHPWGSDFGGGPLELPEDPATLTFCLGVTPASQAPVRRTEEGVPIVNQDAPQHLLCSPTVSS